MQAGKNPDVTRPDRNLLIRARGPVCRLNLALFSLEEQEQTWQWSMSMNGMIFIQDYGDGHGL